MRERKKSEPRERPKARFPQIRVQVYKNDFHPVFIENRVIEAMRKAKLLEVEINRMTYNTSNDMEATIDILQSFVRLDFTEGRINHQKAYEDRIRKSA